MLRFIYFFLLFFVSCTGNSQRIDTPKIFINNVLVEASIYSKDSAAVITNLYLKVKTNEASFFSTEYSDSTRLFIDKILYDSTKNKIAVFVLAENPISRRKYPDLTYKVYYHAYCYLGKRTEKGNFELKWFSVFYPINFYNKEEIAKAIGQLYFTELATILDGDNKPVYKYNLDDKRFWTGPGWELYFDE